MRTLFGMILGACLTVGAAFALDHSAGRTGQQRMVNWEVVDQNMQVAKVQITDAWNNLKQRLSG